MTFSEVPYKCVNFHFLHDPKKSQAILPLAPGGKLGSSDDQNELASKGGKEIRNGNVEW